MNAKRLAWALILAPTLAAAQKDDAHRAPEPSLAARPAVSSERQAILSEMWQRRILSLEADQWTSEDLDLLNRIRAAESSGAIETLKKRALALGPFVVSHKPAGVRIALLKLTKPGYERYALIRSQDALAYFGRKGVDAKWAFALRDVEGRKLFDSSGVLTDAGEEVYARALAGLEAHWQSPSGEVFGNRPPPRLEPPK